LGEICLRLGNSSRFSILQRVTLDKPVISFTFGLDKNRLLLIVRPVSSQAVIGLAIEKRITAFQDKAYLIVFINIIGAKYEIL
jgi:hypothetical protein